MKKPPTRFWVAIMIFFTTFTNYMMRANMSISLVAMVKPTKGKVHVAECVLKDQKGNDSNATAKEPDDFGARYEWDQNIQGLILGAYFYGFIVTCLPAGIVSEWVGPFNIIFYTTILSAIFTALTALSAGIHWSCVFVCRFIVGLLGGFIFPAVQCLISRWAPPKEKGKFLGAMLGNTIGTVVTWPIVGVVTEALGWDWGFYVLSISISLYLVAFFFVVADSPQQHKRISEEEKQYILESQGGTVSTKKSVPPYIAIFKSLRFWALAIAQFGNLWGLYLIITGAPKYMAEVLGFNLRNSGFLSSLPYLARFLMAMMFGSMADWIRKKEFMSVTNIRRLFTVFSHLLPAAFLCLMIFVECNWKIVVAFLILNQGFNGAVVAGHLQNTQDLSPNYSGTLYGIISFIGGTTGFVVPSVTGLFTYKNNGVSEWNKVFLLGGAVYSLCGIFFMIFVSGETQSWNEKKEDAA